jgi:hypothetical protein
MHGVTNAAGLINQAERPASILLIVDIDNQSAWGRILRAGGTKFEDAAILQLVE